MKQSFEMKVSGNPTIVNIELSEAQVAEVTPIHHILLLDGSGSMDRVTTLVHTQTLQIIDRLVSDIDSVTVIQFRGPKDFRVLTQETPKLQLELDNLNKLRQAGGTTCFSDPFAFLESLVNTSDTTKTMITLLTDGCPCVPWSDTEELGRVYTSITNIADKNQLIAVNTIGYGNYYNKDFCTALTRLRGNGQFNHSDNINLLFSRYEDLVSVVSNATDTRVLTGGNYIIHLALGENSQAVLTNTNELHSNMMSGDNLFITVTDTAVYPVVPQSVIDEEHLETAKFALALAYYENNNRMNALDIIVNSVRDKYLADMMIGAFTREEVQEVTDRLRQQVLFPNSRFYSGKCSVGYLPKKDAFCIIDLFNLAQTFEVKYLPFHKEAEEYNRVTQKVTDEFNIFTPTDMAATEASFEDVVWNSERLNLSLKFEIAGTVQLNPKQASENNLNRLYPTKIYRTHTFVKDGSLNIKSIVIKATTGFVDALTANKVKWYAIDGDRKYISIDLSKIPMINRMYASLEVSEIYDLVVASTYATAHNKIIKEFISEIETRLPSTKKVGEYVKLNAAQISVLETHGISERGVYQGVDNTKDSVTEADFYEARKLDFELAGFSSFPKTEDVTAKIATLAAGKSLTPREQAIYDAYLVCENKVEELKEPKLIIEWLREQLASKRNLINANTATLAAAKIAKVIIGDWWVGTSTDDKGKEFYQPTELDTKLMVKTSRTKVYF